MHDSERERIFGAWLSGHKGILFKVVHAYAFGHADWQDLFQEIAIQVWRSVKAFRGDSSVPTWMYRVALNTALAWTRKQDRHQRDSRALDVGELRRGTREVVLPHKRRLEAQLKELDGQ